MPRIKDIKKVLVIGSGPIIIGQAAEFDYAGTQACRSLNACFGRVQPFDFHFAGFQKCGGNLRRKGYFPVLKKAVILPHDKSAVPVRAVIVFLALMDGGTAAGAFADFRLFRFETLLVAVGKEWIGFYKLPRHSFNAG